MFNFFKCKHKRAVINTNEGYCPDCGEYVRKFYYVLRCDCCGIKRFAKKCLNEIKPVGKFCTNCGSTGYKIEKYEKLSLVDIDYALEVKETSSEFGETENIEIWIETPKQKPDSKFLAIPSNLKYLTG